MMRASETESVVMRRICALLILLLAVLGPARADTILTGGLVVNQTGRRPAAPTWSRATSSSPRSPA